MAETLSKGPAEGEMDAPIIGTAEDAEYRLTNKQRELSETRPDLKLKEMEEAFDTARQAVASEIGATEVNVVGQLSRNSTDNEPYLRLRSVAERYVAKEFNIPLPDHSYGSDEKSVEFSSTPAAAKITIDGQEHLVETGLFRPNKTVFDSTEGLPVAARIAMARAQVYGGGGRNAMKDTPSMAIWSVDGVPLEIKNGGQEEVVLSGKLCQLGRQFEDIRRQRDDLTRGKERAQEEVQMENPEYAERVATERAQRRQQSEQEARQAVEERERAYAERWAAQAEQRNTGAALLDGMLKHESQAA